MTRTWNADQISVFDDYRSGTGNVCVSAVPGGGKSSTAVEMLNHPPKGFKGSTLLTSFSSQSVADLKAKDPPWDTDVRTMNSLGYRACRERFDNLKISPNYVFGVVNEVLGEPPADLMLKASFSGFRSRIKALVDLAKNTLTSGTDDLITLAENYDIEVAPPEWMRDRLSDIFKCPWEDALGAVTNEVLEACKNVTDGSSIDFNDQLWLPVVLNLELEKFARIIGDEAQDLSNTQIELLLRSLAPGGRIFGFGESGQAIYKFRGAGGGLDPLIKRTNMKSLPLSISYRCARSIVREAQKINPLMQHAPDAPEGSVTVCFKDALLNRLRIGDTVISRTNAPLVRLFMQCLGIGIPVGMQGRDLGARLLKFVEDSKSRSADELLEFTKKWAAEEIERRQKRNANANVEAIDDHVACIEALTMDTSQIDVVVSRIKQILQAPEGAKILLTSCHKAKGLEWPRVFLLEDTFPVRPAYWTRYASMKRAKPEEWAAKRAAEIMQTASEERNILYVATTRAQTELIYVREGVVA